MGYRRSQYRKEKLKKSKYNSNIKYDSEKEIYKTYYDFNYWSLKYGKKYYRKKTRKNDTSLNYGSYKKIKKYVQVG